LTAVTRVDSTGLLDAAVATGAVDMPVKLPAPEDGTAEQAGPNGFDAVCADWVGAADAADEDEDGVPDPELAEVPLEPHAAAPNARPADRTAMAGTLYFMVWTPFSFALTEQLG
jgi:hypothetical protein